LSKLHDNLSKLVLQFLSGKRYKPMTAVAMLKALGLPKEHQKLLQSILNDLIEKKAIKLEKRTYSLNTPSAETTEGLLRMHPRGFGFVQTDGGGEDIFIPKHLTDGAVDGDRVEVEVNQSVQSAKGPEGKIVSVISRGRTHIGGIIHDVSSKGVVQAYCPLLGASKPVMVTTRKKVKVGDRVILKVSSWGNEETATTGEVSHVFGHISDPSIDNLAAIEEYDLRNIFPKPALTQAEKWGTEVAKKDFKGREDLTKLKTVTIDPETAKDFDDALSLSKDKKGNFHLAVHIADVAHYVPTGSPLDKEARERCNSTYFPAFCLPMLPHELSDHLCSLRPNVIRLAVSVLMDFDSQGNLLDHRICRSYIKSNKRFSYEEAKEVLDSPKKNPFKPMLELMVELCHLLKKKRAERGSIDFGMPELVLLVDAKGMPTGTKRVEYDITHQLVEEFMLKANETVARHLSEHGKPVIFRTHEDPAEENIEDFYALARSLGFPLPPTPTSEDLQKMFDLAKKSPYAQQLSVAFIRSMKLAYYSPENVGHYGLALDYYCHFTSPIRRYSDLIIQRLLFNEEGKDIDVEKIADKCSEQERISFRAEMSVRTLKKFRLLNQWIQEDPTRIYTAYITRIKPFGLFFELPDIALEGFLHISELENDYFIFNERNNTLVGRRTNHTYKTGEALTVRPTALDLILLESKWELVTKQPRTHGKRRR